ncbi:hypothetical protein [Qipengyuania gaetbuli]|uniref:hypothetical protein n=1 Tax=Qipengyuania gaetbuli TaxID=266952 RepID=UPI001CFEDD7A|nr:hypothetical protein [Qipengyuania gaetbuli]
MSSKARFKQVDVTRALRAARDCGFQDVRVRIDPAGLIEIIVGQAANDSPPPVELE